MTPIQVFTKPTDSSSLHVSCDHNIETIYMEDDPLESSHPNDDDRVNELPSKLQESITQSSSSSSLSPPSPSLTSQQRYNVMLLVLGFSCVVAGLALIVGTGPSVTRSIGGDASIAPMTLACVFVGMSIISITVTHWVFDRFGRKIGFWCGCGLCMLGSIMGTVGLLAESVIIVLLADLVWGAGTGIGMYLRFASVEVVPIEFAAKAVAWTLCGGCLAAFAGPEVAAAVTGVFGGGNKTYLGVFMVAFCLAVTQGVFVAFVKFDTPTLANETRDNEHNSELAEAPKTNSPDEVTLKSLLSTGDFLIPLLISILSWSIMAIPMSIFRVTMGELGFTDRQSLTVIEFHFLAKYGPGLVSGSFIKKYGSIRACQVAVTSFAFATAVNFSAQENNNTAATWFLGQIFSGIGWNFGFSAATVWVTKVYASVPRFKSKVQAANDAGTFFLSGWLVFSTGYIYNAGGQGLPGWRTLNFFSLALMALLIVIVLVAMRLDRKEVRLTTENQDNMDCTADDSEIPMKREASEV